MAEPAGSGVRSGQASSSIEVVHGIGVEEHGHGRCVHWHSELDVLALLAPCCHKFYACAECHVEVASSSDGHALLPWPESTPITTNALMCGVCQHRLSIAEYVNAAESACPACHAHMNPGCKKHWHVYFDPRLVARAQGRSEGRPTTSLATPSLPAPGVGDGLREHGNAAVPFQSPRGGDLSDTARLTRVLTCCGRWNALIRRWGTLTDRGLTTANDVVNTRLSRRYTASSALGSLTRVFDAQSLFETHYFEETRRLYPQIELICSNLKTVADQMAAVSSNLQALAEGPDMALGLGATVREFAESSTALSMLYSKEYAVREVICRTLLSPKHDRRSYLLMLTTWMSEPYVDNDSHIKRYVQEMVNHVMA
eukprot:m.214511 g.214511  ORF g.214511 m.214511 type:complete len:369 (-) comp25582_c0_seq4:53-1159(-)